jgi:gas vesicle protein
MARDEGSGFAWFLAGLGVGAVIGVLYAPKSGSETRRAIVEGAEQGRDYVKRTGQQVRDQASQWVDRGRQIFEDQKETFASAIQAGKQAYRESTTARPGESNYTPGT